VTTRSPIPFQEIRVQKKPKPKPPAGKKKPEPAKKGEKKEGSSEKCDPRDGKMSTFERLS
jgi:hypothetical protein